MTQGVVEKLYKFLETIQMLSQVERRIIHLGGRHENDAEHSWALAVMTIILAPYHDEQVDERRAIKLALIHDLPELIAGDTPAYTDQAGVQAREGAAAKKLFEALPDPIRSEFFSLWIEWEAQKTPEARFVKFLDRLQPLIMNVLSGGTSWKEFGITEAMVHEHKLIIEEHGGIMGELLARFMAEARLGRMFHEE